MQDSVEAYLGGADTSIDTWGPSIPTDPLMAPTTTLPCRGWVLPTRHMRDRSLPLQSSQVACLTRAWCLTVSLLVTSSTLTRTKSQVFSSTGPL